jgi:hypothetical protein
LKTEETRPSPIFKEAQVFLELEAEEVSKLKYKLEAIMVFSGM